MMLDVVPALNKVLQILQQTLQQHATVFVGSDFMAWSITINSGQLMVVPMGLVIYVARELTLEGECFIDVNGELVII
jgi:hypothetical protein